MSEAGYPDLYWMVTAGIIFSAIYAFAIGANDVANSFGSSVSAKSLTIPQAIVVAVIMETSGAILLGANVTDTIRGKIFNSKFYTGDESLIMTGMLCALIVGAFWLLWATYAQMPVSTTHTIVASICGFTYAAKGMDSINMKELTKIFISWVASPTFCGTISFIFFSVIKYTVLRARDPFARSLLAYPVIVFIGITIDVWLVLKKSNNRIAKTDTNWVKRVSIPAAFGTGIGCALITFFFICPFLKKRIERIHREKLEAEEAERQAAEEAALAKTEDGAVETESVEPSSISVAKKSIIRSTLTKGWNYFADNTFRQDLQQQSFDENKRVEAVWSQQEDFDPRAEFLFQYVQVFTACLTAFAHGANDVANAVGPLSAIMQIQKGGLTSKSGVELWVLAMGGGCIGVGFIFFGYRIIKAVGYKITKITPSRGASLELSTALAVAIASYLSIPVSSTQCLVGATAGVALASGGFRAVEWVFLVKVMFSWAFIFFIAAICTGLFFSLVVFSPGYVLA